MARGQGTTVQAAMPGFMAEPVPKAVWPRTTLAEAPEAWFPALKRRTRLLFMSATYRLPLASNLTATGLYIWLAACPCVPPIVTSEAAPLDRDEKRSTRLLNASATHS